MPETPQTITVMFDGRLVTFNLVAAPIPAPQLAAGEIAVREFDLYANQMWTFGGHPAAPPVPPLTEEQLADQEALRLRRETEAADNRRRRAEREKDIRAARVKARETLMRMLSTEQRESFERSSYFTVTGSAGNLYRIWGDTYSGNIFWVDKQGKAKANFCCHPNMVGRDLEGRQDSLPLHDALICQKLMIEADEIEFLRTTVCNSGRRPEVASEHIETSGYGDRRCICKACEESRLAWIAAAVPSW